MGNIERQEKRDVQDVVRAGLFLKMTNKLLSRFAPAYEDDKETILSSIVVPLRNGDVTINASGTRDERGFLEAGRIHFIKNGKQTTIEVKAVALSYPDMKMALKAMRAVSWFYRNSGLPRREKAL